MKKESTPKLKVVMQSALLSSDTLGLAAWEGQSKYVKLLVEHGWDLHSKAHQGRTPLQHAQNRKHSSIVKVLREAGAVF